ncbi:FYN-binding protein 1 isoform X4 [Pleuronectes platessa]|nr:FYN-binding protein 1 isoform X4 [Pleuronectes platessa]
MVVKCTQVVKEEEEEEEEEGKKDEGSSPDQHTAGPSVPQQSSTGSPPSVDQSKPLSPPGSPPCTSSSSSKAPPEPICVSSPPHPVEPPSDPEPSIDSQSFWKSCNAAGCTQAIFTDFINEMNDIAGRIQSDQASEDDCNHALKVMAASGKLEEIVAKQQTELQRKQQELMKAAAAMQHVFLALRR